MEQNEILDDLKEIDAKSGEMNATWQQWFIGLFIGMIVHFTFDSLTIGLESQISNLNSTLPLDINYSSIIYISAIFISVFFYLFFSSASRQPFKRILLLALISSIFYCFSFIIVLSIFNETSFYEEFIFYLDFWQILASSFVKNFIFFLFTALLFRRKFSIGMALIVLTFIVIGLM